MKAHANTSNSRAILPRRATQARCALLLTVALLFGAVMPLSAATYYSYNSGNWGDAGTWTLDPSGTTLVNQAVPGNNDVVVILSGREVTLNGNVGTTGLQIEIKEDGILNLSTFRFTSAITRLHGLGMLRVGSDTFPNITNNAFIAAGGGTVEYVNAASFTLPTGVAAYNNLSINVGDAVVATLKSNLTLAGDLTVRNGKFQINDNTNNARRTLTVNGDVLVEQNGAIGVGTGVTNTTTTPATPGTTGTAPKTVYYTGQSHTFEIFGSFTNHGTVRFTNLAHPVFNQLPPTTAGATSGYATVFFSGDNNATLLCDGTTDFYNLVVNKGSDHLTSLVIRSTAYEHFRLFGANSAPYTGTANDPMMRKALWIYRGTLELTGAVVIPSLTEGTLTSTAIANDGFVLPVKSALVLNGAQVIVLSTADKYEEVNAAYGLNAGTGAAHGVQNATACPFISYGTFRIEDGYFSTRESRGIMPESGFFYQNGGVVDTKQFAANAGSGFSFNQSGGVLYARGQLKRQPADYNTAQSLAADTEGTIPNERSAGRMATGKASFHLLSDNSAVVTGGEVIVYDNPLASGFFLRLNCTDGRGQFSGGVIRMYDLYPVAGSSVQFVLECPVYDLEFVKGAGTTRNFLPSSSIHCHSLNLTRGTLRMGASSLTLGGDITVLDAAALYCPNRFITFNGTDDQLMTFGAVAANAYPFSRLRIDKPAGSTVKLAGAHTLFRVTDSVDIVGGTLDLGSRTLAITGTAGTTAYFLNSGEIVGSGRVHINSNKPAVIGGDGNGSFQNLTLQNNNSVTFAANTTVNGNLEFASNRVAQLGDNRLTLGLDATITGATEDCYFATSGQNGAGGMVKVMAPGQSFTYPVGAPSTARAASAYTPATIALTTLPAGKSTVAINVVPVGMEHPCVTAPNLALTYFWRVFAQDIDPAETLAANLTFQYDNNDVPQSGHNDANYKTGFFDPNTALWSTGDNANTAANTFSHTISNLPREYSAGAVTAGSSPFYAYPAQFRSVRSARWNQNQTWQYSPAGEVLEWRNADRTPDANDLVVIRNGHTVELTASANCATLQIEAGGVLDVKTYTNSNFSVVRSNPEGNGRIRVTTTAPSNNRKTVFFDFPRGDFSDFNQGRGTTEFYDASGAATYGLYILSPDVDNYGNLVLTSTGQGNIVLPNIPHLTIYGDLQTGGSQADSWVALAWATDNGYDNANDYWPVVEKTVVVKGDMTVKNGSFKPLPCSPEPQHLIVEGNVSVENGAQLSGREASGGTYYRFPNVAHTIEIRGDLITKGTGSVSLNNSGNQVPLFMTGSDDATISRTGSGNITLASLIIDKGGDIDNKVTLLSSVGLPDNGLSLVSGTFDYAHNGGETYGSANFFIPYCARFIKNGTGTVTLGSSQGLDLEGELVVKNGTLTVGRSISYNGVGTAGVIMEDGTLNVNYWIQRSPSNAGAALRFVQSDGMVNINTADKKSATNALFEILNDGSEFTISGGTIQFTRGDNTAPYGDVWLRPAKASATGGEIIFTVPNKNNNETSVYRVESTAPFYDFQIKSPRANRKATVNLMQSTLVVNGDLIISANSTFDATTANVDVVAKKGFSNSGTYNTRQNTTYFESPSEAQSVAGSTPTNFYNLVMNTMVSLGFTSSFTVNNDITALRGRMILGSGVTVTVKGDVYNHSGIASYTASNGGLLLNGTRRQYIQGAGLMPQVRINNANGVEALSDIIFRTGNLYLENGVLSMGSYLLTLDANSQITKAGGAQYGPTRMITTDGVFTSQGVRKTFAGSNTATEMVFPLGTGNVYTPFTLRWSAIGNNSTIRVTPVASCHPVVLDHNNVLQYYWDVEGYGVNGYTGSFLFNYDQSDVAGTEGSYLAGRCLLGNLEWAKIAGGVNAGANTIEYSFSSATDVNGQYTAGTDVALPDIVPQYRSVKDGNWTDATVWEKSNGTTYDVPAGGPNGFVVTIDHEVTLNTNFCTAYRSIINGTVKALSPTMGHNLGIVSGTGTLFVNSSLVPAGRYTDFLSCDANGTLEFGGTGTYVIVADLFTEISNMRISGTGTRMMPNRDVTVCRSLEIDGATLDNSAFNRGLVLRGTFDIVNGGQFRPGNGNAYVSFAGTEQQLLGDFVNHSDETYHFHTLKVDNPLGLLLDEAAKVEVKGNLELTNGVVVVPETASFTITNFQPDCVVPDGGSETSYVDGRMAKDIVPGEGFRFPVGRESYLGNGMKLLVTNTGSTTRWTAQYHMPNPTNESFLTPLKYVNGREYWTVNAPAPIEARISIDWDQYSDLTPVMTTQGVKAMTIANYKTAATRWEQVTGTASGTMTAGTATSKKYLVTPTDNQFTLATTDIIKPRAQLVATTDICQGDDIPIRITSNTTLYPEFTIGYTVNGVAQTPLTFATNSGLVMPAAAVGEIVLTSFSYKDADSKTLAGVVDAFPVNVVAQPTTAYAGNDKTHCGLTESNLNAGTVLVGEGLWTIVEGEGGYFVNATRPSTKFVGALGGSYLLRWTVSNGDCESYDELWVSFPLTADQPKALTAGKHLVAPGETVTYTVPNDPSVTYNWQYSGNGETITGTGNSISMAFSAAATSGILSVTASNSCGASDPTEFEIEVQTPVVELTSDAQAQNHIVCLSSDHTFTVNKSTAHEYEKYLFYKNGDKIYEGPLSGFEVTGLTNKDTIRAEAVVSGDVRALTSSLVVTAGDDVWTGATGSDWFDIANWGCGKGPAVDVDAYIPANALNMPSIDATRATASVRNVVIENGATLSQLASSDNNLAVYGDWTNDGTTSGLKASFVGAAPQSVAGAGESSFDQLTFNNAAGVDVASLVKISGQATFTDGVVTTTAAAPLTFMASATSNGGNDTSFVDGPVTKIGAGEFVFPTGDNGKWARLGLTEVTGDASTAFTAEYVYSGCGSATSLGSGLHHVSEIEHWTLSNAGAGTAKVTLYWDDINDSWIKNMDDLRLAYFDGSNWMNAGGTGTETSATTGYITSESAVSGFEAVSFASAKGPNPLPVELLHFSAMPLNGTTVMSWATASENDNDRFIVERSADAVDYEPVVTVYTKAANGYSATQLNYSATDFAPLAGVSYYRLRQLDRNGESKLSPVVAVNHAAAAVAGLVAYPNPTSGMVNFMFSGETDQAAEVEIYNATGSRVALLPLENGQATFDMSALPAGLYLYRVDGQSGTLIRK